MIDLRFMRLPHGDGLPLPAYATAGAAGLDVFRKEPDFDTRLAALPNVFLTPHVASATVDTRDAMGFRTLDNIAGVLSGRGAIDPV